LQTKKKKLPHKQTKEILHVITRSIQNFLISNEKKKYSQTTLI